MFTAETCESGSVRYMRGTTWFGIQLLSLMSVLLDVHMMLTSLEDVDLGIKTMHLDYEFP